MALNLLLPTQLNTISFLDSSKYNYNFNLFKLQGGCNLKRKGVAGKRVQCWVQSPPPAWPGRAVVEPGWKSWDGPKPIAIVGSTGSIGTQTLDIVAENPDKFRVVALAAGSNVTLLADQVKAFKPQLVAVRNESLVEELREALADVEDKPEIIPGEQGVIEVARHPDAVTVVTGIVGCAGLKPTVAAIEAGKDIALANKETLIAGGPFVLPLAHKHKVKILPADSEHSAIFQCIQGLPEGALRKIILTASGGAFRDWPVEKLKEVKVADALKHPNWNMGKKITVDSATLFNKGLEVIEAHYLFGAEYDDIEIVIHPQSIIHSMVETQDSSVLAQLGWPDMRLPILYTLSWPDRVYCSEITWPRLDLCKLGSLTFKAPDNVKYPSMDLAYAAGRAGGTMTGVLSAANEKAVELFIDEKISYLDIFKIVELTCDKHRADLVSSPSLDEIIHYDLWAREYAASLQLSTGEMLCASPASQASSSIPYPKIPHLRERHLSSTRLRVSGSVQEPNGVKVEYTPWLIVGLGNPGNKYHGTRHNVGFEMIDRISEAEGIVMNTIQSKSLIGIGSIGNVPLLLAKPQAYMNFSGEAVGPLAAYYQVPLRHILLIYDEMNLPNGVLRLQPKGGHGHHNGVKSVIEHLDGCKEFPRFCIGIGNPPGTMDFKAFLLQKFSVVERQQIDGALEQGVDAVRTLVSDGFTKRITRFNLGQKYKYNKV